MNKRPQTAAAIAQKFPVEVQNIAVQFGVSLGRALIKSRLFGNRWLPQTTCADCAGSSGGLLPPSPPAEKATASKD
jgi:hypothetical protein